MTVKKFRGASADNFRLARSMVVDSPGVETYYCVQIPQFGFIRDVWLWVQEAGSSDNVQMGFVGNGAAIDDDYFLTETLAEATATGFKRAGFTATITDTVWKPFEGLWLASASGTVTLTVDTAQTSGKFVVLVDYTIIH